MIENYINQYSLLLLFVLLSCLVPAGMLLTAKFSMKIGIRPQKNNEVKTTAYEGGHPAFSDKPSRFSFGYFYYALLFVAFDVETILIFPWAVAHGYISSEWGLLPFVGVLFLLFVLTISFIYVWLKGCLEWIK